MPYKRTGKPSGRPRKAVTAMASRPSLSSEQWAALELEIASIHWGAWLSRASSGDEDLPWPSKASLARIANSVGKSREAVRKWRGSVNYWRGLMWLVCKKINAEISTDEAPAPSRTRSKRDADVNLYVHLKSNWTGPTESPLDGKIYEDAEAFFRHVRQFPDAIWIGDQPRSGGKKGLSNGVGVLVDSI